jgi:hypothetical protein
VPSARSGRAIFDAPRTADKPEQLIPALNMGGSKLNALAGANVPLQNATFAITTGVALAADALLVLMQYQNKGYALMNF